MSTHDDILTLQVRDHAHLDALLVAYAERSSSTRRDIFRELVDLVTTHAFAEEEVLFPAARRALGQEGEAITTEIESQHQRINELLAEMDGLEPGDEAFEARVRELFPLLRADVRNEEERLLARLRQVVDAKELERIGTAWAVAKKAAPNRAHPHIPRRPPGNVLAGLPLFVVDHVRHFLSKRRHTSQ